jgi:hypothetical protein
MHTHVKLILPVIFLLFSTDIYSQLLPQNPRENEARVFAEEWLDLIENEKNKEAFDLLTETFRSNLTLDSWIEINENTKTEIGSLVERKFKRIVVYDNPANAPLPGLYIAVEFDSVYEKASRHFQYIILHSQNDEPFRVMRREVTQLRDG